ncbi:unnamed protein product [Rotaria sp. Silwood1]|nr:unnamed protein product [Rotaria sp. Silwood1]
MPWIQNIFSDGNWSDLATNQFRGRSAIYFLILQSICNIVQSTINRVVKKFLAVEVFKGKMISRDHLHLLIEDEISYKERTSTMFVILAMLAAREEVQINQIMNIFSFNWYFSSNKNEIIPYHRIPTMPVSHDPNCSCAVSSACTESVFVKDKKSPPRSLDEVKQIKNEIQNQFDLLDKELQRKHKELRSQQDLIQELQRLDEQLQKLTNYIQTLKDEIETDKISLEPINTDIDIRTKEKNRLKTEKEKILSELTESINILEQKLNELKTLTTTINNFEDRTSKLLEELRSSFDQLNIQEKQLQSELSTCITTISHYKDDLARADIRYRQ